MTPLFTASLIQGRLPGAWKVGKFVLLRKDGRPGDHFSAYGPIVLLNEVSCSSMCSLHYPERETDAPKPLQKNGPSKGDSTCSERTGESIVSFHLAQILTGHGCFRKFRCGVGRKTEFLMPSVWLHRRHGTAHNADMSGV